MLLLLIFMFISGVEAEGRPKLYYRVTNSSICLEVRQAEPRKADWSFNEEVITMQQEITPKYEKRVDYNPKNHSLCIHQLTEADAGVYEVSLVSSEYKKLTERTTLVVEAPVPKPVIRMSLGSPSSNITAGICKLTVNCSVLGDWLLAVCDQESCRKSDRFYSKVNITITARNGSIVCSGHNHVSTNSTSEKMEKTCHSELHKTQEDSPLSFNEMVIVIAVAAGVMISAFIACLALRLCSAKYNRHQTSAAQSIQSQPIEPHSQPATRDSTSSSQPEASYENVDVTQEELESKQCMSVDTVYSVLQLPQVNDSCEKSDGGSSTKDHEVIVVPLASESEEAEQHMQVDTVYSMVQKPKT